MHRYLSHSHRAFVSQVLPESASLWLLLRATLFRSCSVLGWVDLSSAGVECFMPITEPSLPLTALLGLSFESGDLSVLSLGKLFRKVLYSNPRIPSAASYLGNCFIFFELLQFLSTGVMLWSAFCWDGRMGFWGYSRILKYERNLPGWGQHEKLHLAALWHRSKERHSLHSLCECCSLELGTVQLVW